MLNYQKFYFAHYYILKLDGTCRECNRKECFDLEKDMENSAYPQRWYYDMDSRIAVRLPKNQMGDEIGRRNHADLKREERMQHKNKNVISLDEKEERNRLCELVNFGDSVEDVLEKKEMEDKFYAALEELSSEERILWEMLARNAKYKEIADHFQRSISTIQYRVKKLQAKLKNKLLDY